MSNEAATPDTATIQDRAEALLIEGRTPAHVAAALGLTTDANLSLVLLPGWSADDGNQAYHYDDATSGADAAAEYVGDGSAWEGAQRVHVTTWQVGIGYDDDDEETYEETYGEERHTVECTVAEPACANEHEHDWQSPYDLLGGLEENPGVQGKGGGVIIREVCRHCGQYRVTDTWAQDESTGEQGLTSVEYQDADDDSLAWVAGLEDDSDDTD